LLYHSLDSARIAACGDSPGLGGAAFYFGREEGDFFSSLVDLGSMPTDWISRDADPPMQFLLEHRDEIKNEPCGVCGQAVSAPAGNQLVLAGNTAPVCPDCARKHAPSLAALVNLAEAASRIGRIPRHSVFPPLTALLDLANAAEKYVHATQPLSDC
jgi:hypothetical protein